MNLQVRWCGNTTLAFQVSQVRQVWERLPVFGICLGHQIIGLAAGARTFKLPYGHRASLADLFTERYNYATRAQREERMPIRVSVIGASGYGGAETVRLLATHPEVRLVHVTAETRQGQPLADLYPNLRGFVDLTTEAVDLAAI